MGLQEYYDYLYSLDHPSKVGTKFETLDSPSDQRILILFDLNGTVANNTKRRRAFNNLVLRPGAHQLQQFKQIFRVGMKVKSFVQYHCINILAIIFKLFNKYSLPTFHYLQCWHYSVSKYSFIIDLLYLNQIISYRKTCFMSPIAFYISKILSSF